MADEDRGLRATGRPAAGYVAAKTCWIFYIFPAVSFCEEVATGRLFSCSRWRFAKNFEPAHRGMGRSNVPACPYFPDKVMTAVENGDSWRKH